MPRKKNAATKKASFKRSGTMAITSNEGETFLQEQGHVSHNKDETETRTKKRTREVVDDLLSPAAKKTTELSEEEIDKLRKNLRMAFRLFDTNRDNAIDAKELEAVIRSLGKRPTKEKIQKIMKEADKNGNGTISANEFVDYMINKKKLKQKKEEKEEEKEVEKEESPKVSKKTKKTDSKAKKASQKKEEEKKEEAPKVPTISTSNSNSNSSSSSSSSKAEDTSNRGVMKRGLSIGDFFTPFAGLHDEIQTTQVDKFHNPQGRQYDLGHEKAFNIFNIILYDTLQISYMWPNAIKALTAKGFTVYEAKSEDEFLREIHNYDQAWFTSSGVASSKPEKFVAEIKKYHKSGRGLFIWADNVPLFANANLVLKELFGFQLEGNTTATKILSVGDGNVKGQFARHLLTTGIVNLHEGDTICFPNKRVDKVHVLATSTDGNPCIMYVDPEPNAGPVVIDCGFTKLYDQYWKTTAGTERYVRNVAVWLLGLDYRMKIGSPWKGPITTDASTAESKE